MAMQFEEEDDYDLRHQVVASSLSEEDNAIHEAAVGEMRASLAAGKRFPDIVKGLKVPEGALRAMIIDDFIKITIAERHFQGGVKLKEMSKETGIPMNTLVDAKQSMIKEVEEASIKAYHVHQEQEKKKGMH